MSLISKLSLAIVAGRSVQLTPQEYSLLQNQVNGLSFNPSFIQTLQAGVSLATNGLGHLELAPIELVKRVPIHPRGPSEYFVFNRQVITLSDGSPHLTFFKMASL